MLKYLHVYKRYIYTLPSQDFYDLLVEKSIGVEMLQESEHVIFATYEPLENLSPIKVEEVKFINPKESFRPIFVESFVICPPWTVPIVINPASSFGTGKHPTTQVALKLISKYYKKGWSAIDVGCGSGILSVALKKLGCEQLLAIDIDKNAVKECKQNAKLNGVNVTCKNLNVNQVKESFDFLVANLEISIFKEHMESLVGMFKKVGVFSGLYKKQDLEEFLKLTKGLEILDVQKNKNWYGVVLKK